MKNELGLGKVVTATSEKIHFLYQWAQLWLDRSMECKILKRGYDYLIIPTNIIVPPTQMHLWNKFFTGLKTDNVVVAKFDSNNQQVYTFTSNEVASKIIEDMTK